MKNIFTIIFLLAVETVVAQSVEITPQGDIKFKTGGIKIQNFGGNNGDLLSSTGTGGLNWATNPVITINASNISTVSIPAFSFVKVDGNINLTTDFSFGSNRTQVEGGFFIGNTTNSINFGTHSVISGTYFQDVNINGYNLIFKNCSFGGNILKLGDNAVFINCQINLSSLNANGGTLFDNCNIQNVTFSGVNAMRNCIVYNSTFNSLSYCNSSLLTNVSISLTTLGEANITGNIFRFSKIFVGNSSNFPTSVIISDNDFSSYLIGQTETIEVNPTSGSYKMISILGNHFSMQPGDFSAIKVSGTEGNSLGYSMCQVMNNIFHRGTNTLNYSGNMNLNFSNNSRIIAGGTGTFPGSSGNLQLSNNISF